MKIITKRNIFFNNIGCVEKPKHKSSLLKEFVVKKKEIVLTCANCLCELFMSRDNTE